MHAPPEPTRISSEKVIHQGNRSQGAGCGTTGATPAHVTCENVARGKFLAAPKAISVQEREGGLDTDLIFLLTSFPASRTRGGPETQHKGPKTPDGSRQRTRECYAESSPPFRTGHPDTRAHQP